MLTARKIRPREYNVRGKKRINKVKKCRNASLRLFDRFVICIWALIWRRWLVDCRGNRMRVVMLKGWRTAIVESNWESRKTITPCFSILGVKFD